MKFSLAVPSDIHLGNTNTVTEWIIHNLKKEFPPSMETESLDMITLDGDVFDKLLHLSDDNIEVIEYWIKEFLTMCKKFDIVVRILEGTPSHDWKQSKMFETVNELSDIGCDVKHIKNLSIEYIEKFNMNFLYVPDEWHPETDETWKQVKELLALHGLKKVDIAFMHGCFPHQLPSHVKVPMHDPDRYMSIVKYVVIIGHIHKHAVFDRIITPGSFDRLCHGEEEPKGHIRFYLNEDETWNVKFIENKNAKIYKTISCVNLPVEEALERVSLVVKGLPKYSHIRIAANKDDAIFSGLDVLKTKFPEMIWSNPKIPTKNTDGKEMLVDMRAKFRGIDITKDNLHELMMSRITNKIQFPETIQRCNKLLVEVISHG